MEYCKFFRRCTKKTWLDMCTDAPPSWNEAGKAEICYRVHTDSNLLK